MRRGCLSGCFGGLVKFVALVAGLAIASVFFIKSCSSGLLGGAQGGGLYPPNGNDFNNGGPQYPGSNQGQEYDQRTSQPTQALPSQEFTCNDDPAKPTPLLSGVDTLLSVDPTSDGPDPAVVDVVKLECYKDTNGNLVFTGGLGQYHRAQGQLNAEPLGTDNASTITITGITLTNRATQRVFPVPVTETDPSKFDGSINLRSQNIPSGYYDLTMNFSASTKVDSLLPAQAALQPGRENLQPDTDYPVPFFDNAVNPMGGLVIRISSGDSSGTRTAAPTRTGAPTRTTSAPETSGNNSPFRQSPAPKAPTTPTTTNGHSFW